MVGLESAGAAEHLLALSELDGDQQDLLEESLKNGVRGNGHHAHSERRDDPKMIRRAGADVLDWFYHLTGGHTHTDFFAIRPTDYSKANEGEDFEDIW